MTEPSSQVIARFNAREPHPCAALFTLQSFKLLRKRNKINLLLFFSIIIFHNMLLFGQASPFANLQVGHESWTIKDGAPGDVMALAQTADGFLWLGTPTGLFRYDGARFEPFQSPFGRQLLSSRIYSLFAPSSGGLWVGYASGGFSFVNNGRVTNYEEPALSTGTVGNFVEDRDGLVWAGTSSGLWRFDRSSWKQVGSEWNAPAQANFIEVGADQSGVIWVLSNTPQNSVQLSYLLPESRRFRSIQIDIPVAGFTMTPEGRVLTSAASKRLLQGSTGFNDGPPGYPVFGKNCHQLVDRTNSIWKIFSVTPSVLVRTPGPGTLPHAQRDASQENNETFNVSPFVRAKLVDRDGNVWFGDRMGLHRFFYSPLVRQELPDGAEGGISFSVAPAENGAIWISTVLSKPQAIGESTSLYLVAGDKVELRKSIPGGSWISSWSPDKALWFDGSRVIWRFANGALERIELPHEMVDKAISWQVITQDRMGRLWVSFWGGTSGAELYRLSDGVWSHYGGREDFPRDRVLTEFTDSVGRVWFGYRQNILAMLDNDRLQVFRMSDGLNLGDITTIYGRGPEIWIGGEFGLQRFHDGAFRSILAVDERWFRGITGIAETGNGDVWINGVAGIVHIRRSEITRALKDPAYKVTGDHFSRREGVPGPLAVISHPNAAVEGSDGRLWFFGSDGVVWLDPARFEIKTSTPPVNIQSISADNRFYVPSENLRLPALNSSVQINYSAVSLSAPDAINIRYKLQEIDKEWHEASAANPVSYRNLAPGSYHFSVAARDTSGGWTGKAATTQFTILPTFYQTRWFLFLCAAMIAGIFWLGQRWRMKQVAAAIQERAEVRAHERVRIARELHDTLLQGVQGLTLQFHVAAQELPQGSRTRESMERALATADNLLIEGRDRISRLRAEQLTHRNLADAFRAVAADLNQEQQVRFSLSMQGHIENIASSVLHELYYIGREAINNAFRHARASEISLQLNCGPTSVAFVVSDNGRGFDAVSQAINPHSGHWGLQGMKERAEAVGAAFECQSEVQEGTRIIITVPARRAYKNRPATGPGTGVALF